MRIAADVMEMMECHASKSPNKEVCGFVYSDRYIPLENISRDSHRFMADPAGLAKVLVACGEPLAIFHTHTSGDLTPSNLDQSLMYYNNSTMIIGGISEGRFMVKYFFYGHQGD